MNFHPTVRMIEHVRASYERVRANRGWSDVRPGADPVVVGGGGRFGRCTNDTTRLVGRHDLQDKVTVFARYVEVVDHPPELGVKCDPNVVVTIGFVCDVGNDARHGDALRDHF